MPYKVLLVGESCKDTYMYGVVDRSYNESKKDSEKSKKVPVFDVEKVITKPGMASNVKESLENLGCEVTFLTNSTLIKKTRIVNSKEQTHLVRIDENDSCDKISLDLLKNIVWNDYDFVVISDYDKGAVSTSLIKEILSKFSRKIFVDTKKKDLSVFENTIIKINQFENEKVEKWPKSFELIVTSGEAGAFYEGRNFSAHPTSGVVDICGAGDNFLSGLCLMYHKTNDMSKSIKFANYCASLCLSTVGNQPLTSKDYQNYVKA